MHGKVWEIILRPDAAGSLALIAFTENKCVKITFCNNSIQSSTPSCNGVSNESEIVDIMYGVESLCTGTATAFINTAHSLLRSVSLNLWQ